MSETIGGPVANNKEANGKNGTSHETHGGLSVQRLFTTPGVNPLDAVTYEKRRSAIYDADGSVVFAMDSLEIPKDWSQLATDIVVSKYFRKAGVPETGTEVSVRQVVYRVARTIREGAEELGNYFATKEDADTFEAELTEILINQKGAFNSPVWFNVGLHHRYNIKGSGGNYFWDKTTDQIKETVDAYSHPQASACFIQSIGDDLMSIFELVKTESRVFKYGSGSGTNFSNLRGNKEKLSGGGTSSGLMSFLEVFDRAAGATKSGGTTRRAAKMVILDIDHPEIVDFITWKAREEKKVAALIAAGYPADFNGEAYRTVGGQNSNNSVRVTDEFMKAYEDDSDFSTRNRTNKQVAQTYKARELMRQIAQAAWACADPGMQYDTTINDWHTCAGSDRIYGSNPCVTGDTLIATAEGMVRIDALLAKSTSVIGADGALHPIEPAFKTGTKPVYQLRTKAGFTLKLTGDHRVFTLNRGDVQACELTKDDVLPLGKTVFGATSLDARLGEFLGLALGDGCLTQQESQENVVVTLGPTEEAVARYAHQQLTSYRKEFGKDGREARDTDIHNPQGTWRLQTSARCVVDELKRLAVLNGGSEKKSLNDAVFQLDKPSVAAILRGLFTADGTVANYGEKSKYISLDSTSLQLLQQTQLLLLSFGVKAKIYRDRRAAGQIMALLPDGKGGRKEYPVQQMHSLRVSRRSREVFAKEIGFIQSSDKQAKLATLNQETSTYADRFEDRVESLSFIGEQPVYDLTEPVTHHFVANGIVVHNCSEYMFLNDTACNLSSINLTKFLREDGSFDIAGYRHTARILFIAQEILVDFSSYPTDKIAKNSHDYRPLGLGYANLGTLLMILGMPYDSDDGRAYAAALTSIMHGEAFKTSAEMARYKGAFPGYAKNKEPMLRVMRKHQAAADKVNEKHLPKDLAATSKQVWREAISLGEKYGYRNAQATVLAPTGCLVAGSLVATDRGLVRIETLGDTEGAKWQDVSFKVSTDEGPKQATKFFVNGVDDVFEVITENGYAIKGTPKHRIKIVQPDGAWVWKRFAELTEGDLVPMPLGSLLGEPSSVSLPEVEPAYKNRASSDCVVPRTMNKDLAELVGLFMGDGSLHERGLRFALANTDQDTIQHTTALIEKLFAVKAHADQEQGYVSVSLNSTRIARWWAACGFAKLAPTEDHQGKGYEPIIPDAILASNDVAIYGAFLRGLFETDGTVNNGVPSLSTKSHRFVQEVAQLLLAMGLPIANIEEQTGGKSGKPVYRTRLANAHYVNVWREKVGFVGARKTSFLQTEFKQVGRHDHIPVTEALLTRVCPPTHDLRKSALASFDRLGGLTRHMAQFLASQSKDAELTRLLGFFFTQITSAELVGREATYDISVPENVTYVANGFISHNTIGLLMDCDTTGVEPDFSLVKFKKLAGGGYFKIVNESVPRALKALGYTQRQINEVIAYARGTQTLEGTPHINMASLRAKGLNDADLEKIQKTLPGAFDLNSAFSVWTLGEEAYRRLGISVSTAKEKGFNALQTLGFGRKEIEEASDIVCGRMTTEGAPHLKQEHYAVFDCANRCGRIGKRFIEPMGHLRMMGAVQPFLSGAISKTVNIPSESTVEDVEELYVQGWKLGLKAVAIYRDGSKLSQPLSTKSEEKKDKAEARTEVLKADTKKLSAAAELDTTPTPRRRRLPKKRYGFTQEVRIGGQKLYIRTGEYEDGALGEIFIDMHKEGAAFRSMMNAFAISVSLGLQYGVPLDEYVEVFTFTRFEPQGITDHPNIRSGTSVLDFIFRLLGMEYLGRTDFVQVPPILSAADDKMPAFTSATAKKLSSEPILSIARVGDSDAKAKTVEAAAPTKKASSLSTQMSKLMGDAPFCDTCGHLTIRNGSCYKCLNCGNSMGCS